jgi:hypothetical protein
VNALQALNTTSVVRDMAYCGAVRGANAMAGPDEHHGTLGWGSPRLARRSVTVPQVFLLLDLVLSTLE